MTLHAQTSAEEYDLLAHGNLLTVTYPWPRISSPPVPFCDRSRATAPFRRARSLPASPSTPLWSADFANHDLEENIIDGATPVDDANLRGAHSARRAGPSTRNPTGGGWLRPKPLWNTRIGILDGNRL